MLDIAAGKDQTPKQAHAFFILGTAQLARDAYGDENAAKFYAFITTGLNLVSPVLDMPTRERVESDHTKMNAYIKAIKRDIQDGKIHPNEGKKLIDELKLSFAEAHAHLVYASMSRTELFRPEAEGTVDFSKQDLASIANTIRGYDETQPAIARERVPKYKTREEKAEELDAKQKAIDDGTKPI